MARNSLTPFRPGGLFWGGDPFLSLHREVNRLFDDALRGGTPGASGEGQAPGGFVNARMNVSETDKEIRVTVELPGVSENDIDVSLDDDLLTIRGEKRIENRDETENFHFVERSFGSFQRSLRLPFSVDPEKVQADFQNGVLTVTLPKTVEQERSRRIQVKGAGRQPSQIETTAASGEGSGQRSGTGEASRSGGK
jgi:HSP20 family protein